MLGDKGRPSSFYVTLYCIYIIKVWHRCGINIMNRVTRVDITEREKALSLGGGGGSLEISLLYLRKETSAPV